MKENAAEDRAVPGRGARALSRCRGAADNFTLGFIEVAGNVEDDGVRDASEGEDEGLFFSVSARDRLRTAADVTVLEVSAAEGTLCRILGEIEMSTEVSGEV